MNENQFVQNFTHDEADGVCPLSSSCIKNLIDKVYEKRKSAALEIQKLIKSFVVNHDTKSINKIIQTLKNECILSHNLNARKGGCIGLAATAIGLEKHVGEYVGKLVTPVVTCFYDSDNGVRYFACEALYNIVKVCRADILTSAEAFKEVFNGLSKLACDIDQNVKNGSEPLDRLLKDIVIENQRQCLPPLLKGQNLEKSCKDEDLTLGISEPLTAFQQSGINENESLIETLIDLLKDMIYTKNSYGRQFVVSWLSLINDITQDQNKLLALNLPKLLDGLLLILEDDNLQVRKSCQVLLQQLLNEISDSNETNSPSFLTQMDAPTLINILIIHSKSQNEIVQEISLNWIKTFVLKLDENPTLNANLIPFIPSFLAAILPCLKNGFPIQTLDIVGNNTLQTITEDSNYVTVVTSSSQRKKSMSEASDIINRTLLNLIITWGKSTSPAKSDPSDTKILPAKKLSSSSIPEHDHDGLLKKSTVVNSDELEGTESIGNMSESFNKAFEYAISNHSTGSLTSSTEQTFAVDRVKKKSGDLSAKGDTTSGKPDSLMTKTHKRITKLLKEDHKSVDIRNLVLILVSHIQHSSEHTRLAVLNWISHLFTNIPEKIAPYTDELFPVLLNTLNDPSEAVVLQDVKVLSRITSSSPTHFETFMQNLVDLFKTKFYLRHILASSADHREQRSSLEDISLTKLTSSPHHLISNNANGMSSQKSSSNLTTTLNEGGLDFFDNRSSFIIRKLCQYTNPHNIYLYFADTLTKQTQKDIDIPNTNSTCNNPNNNNIKETVDHCARDSFKGRRIKKISATSTATSSTGLFFSTKYRIQDNKLQNLKFVSKMVDLLNSILMTSPELFELRAQLKQVDSHENKQLFRSLYKLWCYNPVATLALCMLTQNYKYSYLLLQSFVDIDITLDFLVEIDKLIQLLESPIFMSLRLKLLEPSINIYLVKTLYGLLMILPQTSAFDILNSRLKCLPFMTLANQETLKLFETQKSSEIEISNINNTEETDSTEMLAHFHKIQMQYRTLPKL